MPAGSIYGCSAERRRKSSTLRMLVRRARPNAGRISVLGGPPNRETMRRVGYLPEERASMFDERPLAIAYSRGSKARPPARRFKRAISC